MSHILCLALGLTCFAFLLFMLSLKITRGVGLVQEKDKTQDFLLELKPETVFAISNSNNWILGFLSEFDFDDSDRMMGREEAEASVKFWNTRKEMFIKTVESTLPWLSPTFYLPNIEMIEAWPEEEWTREGKRCTDEEKRFLVMASDSLGEKCKAIEEMVRNTIDKNDSTRDSELSKLLEKLKCAWKECVLSAHPFLAAQGLNVQEKIFSRVHRDLIEIVADCNKQLLEI